MSYGVLDQTIKTESGLVLKHVARIEDIHTPLEARVEIPFRRWECSRVVRRDFNLITTKMFLLCKQAPRRSQINDFLTEMILQSEYLVGETQQYPLSYDLAISMVPLRIISREATCLLTTFQTVDSVMAKLYCAEIDGHLTETARGAMTQQFFEAYSYLKACVLMRTSDKTASELGRDRGIF